MRGLNKVTLIGNLGAQPDFQQLEGNVAVTKLSLATPKQIDSHHSPRLRPRPCPPQRA